MGRNIDDIIANLPAERRQRIEAETQKRVAEIMTLKKLREAHGMTQTQIGDLMGYKQPTIAQMEKRADLLLSTLRSYVGAMGGDLKLVATFPDHEPVEVEAFGDLA